VHVQPGPVDQLHRGLRFVDRRHLQPQVELRRQGSGRFKSRTP
jgi:hypothetical protein